MNDVIENLNDRDDVARTEFTRHGDDGRVGVEMWHDTESLQRIAERAMTGTGIALSQKGMKNLAEQEALAVRETTVDVNAEVEALYPDIIEQLKEASDNNEDYEYDVARGE